MQLLVMDDWKVVEVGYDLKEIGSYGLDRRNLCNFVTRTRNKSTILKETTSISNRKQSRNGAKGARTN